VPDKTVRQDLRLAEAASTAVVNAPIGKVDIFDWVRTLPDREFQRCAPPDHKAAGYTVTDDGEPLSVAVEMIGTSLYVHHFTYQAATREHCRLVSLSDVLTPAGWTSCQLIWDLRANPAGEHTSRLTNTLAAYPTAEFIEFSVASEDGLAEAAATWQAAFSDHCYRETALLATSIGRYANAVN
jgi:hypothetical protein